MSTLTGRAYGFYNGKVKCIRLKLAAGIAPVKDKAPGDVYYDASANKLKVYNGSAWETVTSST
jgi:hypothetical protein